MNKIRFGEDIGSENKGHMSHFLDGTAYGGHINLVRLLNANFWTIWGLIGVTYRWGRSGVSFGLPKSRDWSMTDFFNFVSAIRQSTLNIIVFTVVP